MTTGAGPGRAKRRVLLTALGVAHKEARYRLGDRTASAQLAPLALLELLQDPVEVVVAVCTKEAAQATFPILKRALAQRNLPLERIEVPEATATAELRDFVEKVTSQVDELSGEAGVRLTVDLTHGFRHHAVLLYVTALYLASRERLEVDHVWYAPLAPEQENEILDLRPLVLLPELVHAVRELRETGSARSLAKVVRSSQRRGSDVAQRLGALTRALVAGLPLEAGLKASEVLHDDARQLRRALQTLSVPLSGQLVDGLVGFLKPLCLVGNRKSGIRLDAAELARQASLVKRLQEWSSLHTAVGLMREWMVSWAIWSERGGTGVAGAEWLDREPRERAERALNALRRYANDQDLCRLLDAGQQRVADLWGQLAELRNAYMHFGMQKQHVDPLVRVDGSDLHKKWDRVRAQWQEFTCNVQPVPLEPSGVTGTVLVSPLGLSPGVLTNAVRAARTAVGSDPDRVIVLCSPASQDLVPAALGQAGYEGKAVCRTLADPFGEVAALRPRKGDPLPDDPDLRTLVAGAESMLVNLTGGTTAMTVVAQQLVEAGRSFDRPVRRFVLVDRRSPEEQQRDPWAECEVVWVDDAVTPDDAVSPDHTVSPDHAVSPDDAVTPDV